MVQMSDSRVSSVIQEWASAFPGQVHGLNPGAVASSGQQAEAQLAQMEMLQYGQAQGMMRPGGDDRAAEHMMGLSYLPYSTSCLGNSPGAVGPNTHSQNHGNSQQVSLDYLIHWNRIE